MLANWFCSDSWDFSDDITMFCSIIKKQLHDRVRPQAKVVEHFIKTLKITTTTIPLLLFTQDF